MAGNWVRQIEENQQFDRVADVLARAAAPLNRSAGVKNALSGAWLGHRFHPMATDVPIGCWTSAALIDALAPVSGRAASRRLIGVGLVAALPTMASGLSDWSDTEGKDRRTGTAHAMANGAAFVAQVMSWRARRKGHHLRGRVWSHMALGALGVGGYLGGHLVSVRGVGVDHPVPVARSGSERWVEGPDLDELPDGRPTTVLVRAANAQEVPVTLVRLGESVYAIGAICNHAGGPLGDGEVIVGVDGEVSIRCPWHGSCFDVVDGHVVRGPASTPQPAYEAEARGGRVRLRLKEQTVAVPEPR
jgi:nitrite reductase/ring-hydroxylating ferredoxin subunit/uncharacterized membrane protein